MDDTEFLEELSALSIVDPLGIHPTEWKRSFKEDGSYYFRYYGGWYGWKSDGTPMLYIELEVFRLHRKTPKGAWIEDLWGVKRRFILDGARRSHAYPTRSEAWASFKIRQRKRMQHAVSNHDGVAALLKKIEAMEAAQNGE